MCQIRSLPVVSSFLNVNGENRQVSGQVQHLISVVWSDFIHLFLIPTLCCAMLGYYNLEACICMPK